MYVASFVICVENLLSGNNSEPRGNRKLQNGRSEYFGKFLLKGTWSTKSSLVTFYAHAILV